MAIPEFKNKSTCIEFKIISKSFEYGCIDISELKDMNIKEHLYWRAGYTTIISVELDNINLEALKMLTLREDIKKIIISNPIYSFGDELYNSSTDNNNVELVEFTPTAYDTYTIRVFQFAPAESSNSTGTTPYSIAWIQG